MAQKIAVTEGAINMKLLGRLSFLSKDWPKYNLKKLEPISNNIYNVNKRYNILEPLDNQYKPRKKYKKDFIKINILNIKKLEKRHI